MAPQLTVALLKEQSRFDIVQFRCGMEEVLWWQIDLTWAKNGIVRVLSSVVVVFVFVFYLVENLYKEKYLDYFNTMYLK